MQLNLTGVLFDGSQLRPGVPANPRTPIRVTRGTSITVQLQVVGAGGRAVDLTGCTLTWSIKRYPTDAIPVASVVATPTGTAAHRGVATFSLLVPAFRQVPAGRYTYDVVLVTGTGARDVVIPLSPLVLEDTDLKF